MISVIIPAYNVEKYIDRCVYSVINQTYKDIEIIIIDDGSTDTTFGKCMEWAEYDRRIRVFSQENQGPGIARNYGLDISKGEYVAFVDADDWLHEKALEKTYRVIKARDVDMVLFEHNCLVSFEETKSFVSCYNQCTYKEPFKITDDYSLFYKITGVLWDALWKKSCFDGIRMPNHAYEDEKVILTMLASGLKIAQLKEPLYYRDVCREDSITHTAGSIEGLETTFCELRNHFHSREDYSKIYDMLRIRVLYCYKYLLRNLYEIGQENMKCYEQRAIAYLNREFPLRTLELTKKILLIGSYNLRLIAKRVASIRNEQLDDFALSSIISAMDTKENSWHMPNVSAYTKEMYKKDWAGGLKDYLQNINGNDYQYVVIDFLEEVRNVFVYQNHFFTEFPQMKQMGIEEDRKIDFLSEEFMEVWKEKTNELIEYLQKKFHASQIILICNQCSLDKIRMGDLQGAKNNPDESYQLLMQPEFELFVMRKLISETLFSCRETLVEEYYDHRPQLLRYNERLKEMYQYFTSNYAGIHVIRIQEEYWGTDIFFPLGTEPYYYNEAYYLQAADQVKFLITESCK